MRNKEAPVAYGGEIVLMPLFTPRCNTSCTQWHQTMLCNMCPPLGLVSLKIVSIPQTEVCEARQGGNGVAGHTLLHLLLGDIWRW